MSKLTSLDHDGLYFLVEEPNPPENLKLNWIREHFFFKYQNQLRLPFKSETDLHPFTQIDFSHRPENQTEIAYSVAVNRNQGKAMRKGRRLTPSSAEALITQVLRNSTDRLYQSEASGSSELFTLHSLRGVVYHSLAETIAQSFAEQISPVANPALFNEQYFRSEDTYLIKGLGAHLGLELQPYLPTLGDGLNFGRALEILTELDIHSNAEVMQRLGIMQILKETLARFQPYAPSEITDPDTQVPTAVWLELRDQLYDELDDLLVKMEIIFMLVSDLNAQFDEVRPIAIEANLVYHLGFKGPFNFEQLNNHPEMHKAFETKKLLDQDVTVIRPQTTFNYREYEFNFQDQEALVSGKVIVDQMGKVKIVGDIGSYLLGVDQGGLIMEQLSESNLKYRAILVSPRIKKYAQDLATLQRILALKDGGDIFQNKNTGRVNYAWAGGRYYFRNWHLQEIGCQLVTKPDLVMRLESAAHGTLFEIYDFKSNFKATDNEGQRISTGIYILNLALHIYAGKSGKLVDDNEINPHTFYASEIGDWRELNDIISRITFYYVDLASGNKVPYRLSAQAAQELIAQIKYLVELNLVYPQTIDNLLSSKSLEP